MTKRNSLKLETFDILSAIWIFSCKDENPMITYQSVNHRLDFNNENKIRELVASRPDLFRQGAPQWRLDRWKDEMRNGNRIPSWIKQKALNEQEVAINELSTSDLFRCQFRTKRDSPPVDIDVIEWGLAHINRLREANQDFRSATAKSWQMWLVFGIGLLNIIVTIILKLLELLQPASSAP